MLRGVSVIIPSFNGLKLLRHCIPPLLEDLKAYKGPSEVIVVDDGSSDGTAEELPQLFPGTKVVRNEENSGFSHSVNRGVLAARHELVFLLNNDARVAGPLLETMASIFDDNSVFAVQPKVVSRPEDENEDYLNTAEQGFGFYRYGYRRQEIKPSSPARMDFVSGGFSLFDKKKFEALGLFDERLSPAYFEDIDACFRAQFFGWKMFYAPGAKIYHLHPGSTVDANYAPFGKKLMHRRNFFLFLLKNRPYLRYSWLYPFTMPAYALAKLLGGDASFAAALPAAVAEACCPFWKPKRPEGLAVRNVLFLDTPIPPPGGGQKSLLIIIKNLRSRTAFLAADSESEITRAARKSGAAVRVHKVSRFGFPFSLLKSLRLIRLAAPSVIHCNSAATLYTFCFALAAKLARVPFAWHVRVVESAGWKDRFIALLADRVIVISDAVGRKFPGYGGSKFVKIHNAVDAAAFRPGLDASKQRAEFRIQKGCKVIGVFSRMDAWKGHELFLSAAALLPDGGRYRFLLAGDGPQREKLAKLARNKGIADRVSFAGLRDDIPELMSLCDVIVNPSIEPEPFGRVIIEAMACGKPVVATAMGGHLEIIRDGEDGFLSKPEPEALAAAILRAAGEGPEGAVASNARRKAETEFGAARQADAIENLYKGLGK